MGKKGSMAIKIDMSKAYNQVEWEFLEQMMGKIGFNRSWIRLIMHCISTVSYSIVLNGEVGKTFWPMRGLRQGDPLSPFLFLISSEGLSTLLRLAREEGSLRGIKACRRSPQITHLLFADDCILFGEASEEGTIVLFAYSSESKNQKINKRGSMSKMQERPGEQGAYIP